MRCLTRDLDSKKKDNAEFSKFKINRDVLPTVFNNIYSTWNLCLRGHKNVRVMGFATVRTDSDEVPLVLKLSRTFQHDAKGFYLYIQYPPTTSFSLTTRTFLWTGAASSKSVKEDFKEIREVLSRGLEDVLKNNIKYSHRILGNVNLWTVEILTMQCNTVMLPRFFSVCTTHCHKQRWWFHPGRIPFLQFPSPRSIQTTNCESCRHGFQRFRR